MVRRRRFAGLLLFGALAAAAGAPEAPFDILITNARIVDGSGGASYRGDIGVRRGRIVRIGSLRDWPAVCVLEANQRVAAPGFIDVHMHVEEGILARPEAENLIADGVTSIVTGNCGGSELAIGDWLGKVAESSVAVNVATLVGHNSVRPAVMGNANRPPTARELAEMEALVRRAMREGAVGFSTGLIYVPGMFARIPEMALLASVAAAHGGVYATHLRNENDKVFEAIEEAIAVASRAKIPLQISHFKVTSRPLWGLSARMLERIEKARLDGIDVTLDQYPYTASSTGLEALLPAWSLESDRYGARRAMLARLRKKRERRRIAKDMYVRIHDELGRDHLDYAVVASAPWRRELDGKNLREINRAGPRSGLGPRPDTLQSEIETVLDLCQRGAGAGEGPGACATQMIYHNMDEGDVERILAHPLTMVARDGGVPQLMTGNPHPRSFGTAARVLSRYVRERRVLSLEEAVRKMTSLPAQRFALRERGLLREGFWADIVLFDPATVQDASTFEDPHHYSRGFDTVLVNGRIVRDDGRPTGTRSGAILYGDGLIGSAPSTAGRALRPFSSDPPILRR